MSRTEPRTSTTHLIDSSHTNMSIRLRYPELAPEGYAALSGFGHYVNTATTLSPVLLGLVNLRASLLNGCGFCIALHKQELRKLHEPASRIDTVEAWQGSDAFTPRERAALRWTDVMTDLAQGSHSSDEDYAAVTLFFAGKDIVDLTFAIANINAWNRMGVAFRPEWRPRTSEPAPVEAAPALPTAAGASPTEEQPAIHDDGGKVAQDS